MKKHTLVIVFNRFFKDKTSYVEVVENSETGSCEEISLKRKPRAARFDEVLETGEGSYNHWNAHRATKLHGHALARPQP